MFQLITDHPIALDSPDHLQPNGAIHDNSTDTAFIELVERHFGRPLTTLDIGCAGGLLVHDFLLRGHHALGLEGSDAPKVEQRGEWPKIPHNLFTCDCSRPFQILFDDAPASFDVITAWEVLEHIPEERLPTFLVNVRSHLAPDGLFLASIPWGADPPWHVTLKERPWWDALFSAHGFEVSKEGLEILHQHRVRGEVETAYAYRQARHST